MGEKVRVAIIGGAGRMGQWFANFLVKDGKEVIIADRDEEKLREVELPPGIRKATNLEAIRSADVILISVPIDSFSEVIAEIYPYIRPRQVIIDITSIKVFPIETMHKYIKAGVVLGVHPMFGPGAKSMKNQNFVLTPTNNDELALAQKVREYLEAKGARVTVMTPQEHDEIMTIVLGLPHFIALVSADTLLSLGRLEPTRTVAGTTYNVLLTLVEGVVSTDPEFYASLQMCLPKMTETVKLFQGVSQKWAELVKNKDRQEFIRRMNILRERLEKEEPDLEKAYHNMYRLVEEP